MKDQIAFAAAEVERYHKIFQQSNDAIFIIDPERDRVVDADPRAYKMLGYSREELLATPVSAIHPNEIPQLEAFADAVFHKGYGWTNELTCTTKQGSVLAAEMSASTAVVQGKTLMIAMIRDISERKQAERTLLEQMKEMAVVEERNRLARDIHDSIAQKLAGIIWQLNASARTVEPGGEAAIQQVERVRELARDCLQEVRRSVWDLRAGPLEGSTLAQALQRETDSLASQKEIQATFAVSGEEKVAHSGVEAAILRICQESLTNVARHSEATQVEVTLTYEDSGVRFEVHDNGSGFDPEVPAKRGRDKGGFGLINMRERARLLGGELTVQSQSGEGTLVRASLPVS